MKGAAPAIADPVGIGFRTPHADALIEGRPPVGWLELHSENYLVEGGPRRWILSRLAENYPVSLHGVGLSLGSPGRPDPLHLRELRQLADDVAPVLMSEHVAWTQIDGYYLADLLPVPLTREAQAVVARNVDIVQQALGRQLLVENISVYGELQPPEMDEANFLNGIVRATGCGLVLDIGNLLVNERNVARDPMRIVDGLDLSAVGEIHLGGHDDGEDGYLLDRHASVIDERSWELLGYVIDRRTDLPVVIEWDQDIPSFDVMLDEADKLRTILERRSGNRAERASEGAEFA